MWTAAVPFLSSHVGTQHAEIAVNTSSWFPQSTSVAKLVCMASVDFVHWRTATVYTSRYMQYNMTIFWIQFDPLIVAPTQKQQALQKSGNRRLLNSNVTQIYI